MNEVLLFIGWASVLLVAYTTNFIIVYPRYRKFRLELLNGITRAERDFFNDIKNLRRIELEQSQAGKELLSLLVQEYPRLCLSFLDEPIIESPIGANEIILPETSDELSRTDVYRLLLTLEIELREFVASRLGQLAPQWWETRVPKEIRNRAEDRTRYPGLAQEGRPAYEYMDFADVGRIISIEANWEEVFKQVFGHINLAAEFEELLYFRNAIAHSRELSPQEHQLFASKAFRILDAIRNQYEDEKIGRK